MKKPFLIFLTLAFCALSVCFLFACGGTPSDGGGGSTAAVPRSVKKFGDKMLKDCKVELTSSDKSLGVEVKTSETVAKNNKGYLVTFDSDNKLKQVKFLYEDSEITQEEIEASVNKVYVTKKFTYIEFVPVGNEYYYNNNFSANAYFHCDETHQSFIINNATHKLYPTNALGTVTNISENYVKATGKSNNANDYSYDYKFYELKIDNGGNLTAEKLVANDNIDISDVQVDKFGNVYAKNSTTSQKSGKYLFYISSYEIEYCLGSDGYMYVLDQSGSSGYTIKRFDSNLNAGFIPNGLSVKFGRYLIKDNRLFSGSDSAWLNHPAINDGVVRDTWSSYTYQSEYSFYITDGDVFVSKNIEGSKTLYRFDTADCTIVDEPIVTLSSAKVLGNSIIVTVEEISGTKQYEVTTKNNRVVKSLLVDVTYKNQIITIQPLN